MSDLLPCLSLPLWEKNVVLPTAAVAEIIPYEETQSVTDVPSWFVGILTWRGIHIPLVYLERMDSFFSWNGSTDRPFKDEKSQGYIAIINRIKAENQGKQKYQFFSFVLRGVPKLYRLAKDGIRLIAEKPEDDSRYLMQVKILNEIAFIPDLANLWAIIDTLPPRLQWFK